MLMESSSIWGKLFELTMDEGYYVAYQFDKEAKSEITPSW